MWIMVAVLVSVFVIYTWKLKEVISLQPSSPLFFVVIDAADYIFSMTVTEIQINCKKTLEFTNF